MATEETERLKTESLLPAINYF